MSIFWLSRPILSLVMRSTGEALRSWTTLTPVAFSKAVSTPARIESPHSPPQVIMTIFSGLAWARAAPMRTKGAPAIAAPAATPVDVRKSRRFILPSPDAPIPARQIIALQRKLQADGAEAREVADDDGARLREDDAGDRAGRDHVAGTQPTGPAGAVIGGRRRQAKRIAAAIAGRLGRELAVDRQADRRPGEVEAESLPADNRRTVDQRLVRLVVGDLGEGVGLGEIGKPRVHQLDRRMHAGDGGDDFIARIGPVALRQVAGEAEGDFGLDAEEMLRRRRKSSRTGDYGEDRRIGGLGIRAGRARLPALYWAPALCHPILDRIGLPGVAPPAIRRELGKPLAGLARRDEQRRGA